MAVSPCVSGFSIQIGSLTLQLCYKFSDAEVTAFEDAVVMLRENDQEKPFNDCIIPLPICIEQHLWPDNAKFIVRATDGHDGQFISFFL